MKDRFSYCGKHFTTNFIWLNICRRSQVTGCYARFLQKKPIISKKNNASNKHVLWSKNCSSVVFSDESKCNVFRSGGKLYVRRRIDVRLRSKCTKKTVKFGGSSVMAICMCSSLGTSPLLRLYNSANAAMYKTFVLLLRNCVWKYCLS